MAKLYSIISTAISNSCSKLLLTFVLFCIITAGSVQDGTAQQQFLLEPPKAFISDNNDWDVRLLHKFDRSLRFDYNLNLNGTGARLKIGTRSNRYGYTEIDVDGNFTEFNPQNIDLPPGRYYARITNSESTRTSDILADPRDDLVFSNEVQLLIESPEAASIIGPRGTTTNSTPVFEWEAVPGVVAYWIIFSSTPFDIVTDENDDISVEGANLVWQYITTETTAQYGNINPNVSQNADAPPLNSGQEYSYTILNLYEEDNPAYASAVFGGLVPMIYFNEDALLPPELDFPADNTEFFAEETITFEWAEVDNADYYRVNLYELVTQQGVDATILKWSSSTSNTLIDYPALGNLKNTGYKWNVTALDNAGGGTTSVDYNFNYTIESGEVRARATDAQNGTLITGVEITATALSGGVTPDSPFLLQGNNITEELVAGLYQLEAKKTGYETNIQTVEVRPNALTNVTFNFQPLPAFINGLVVDETGSAIQNARIVLEEIGSTFTTESVTNSNGEFGWEVPAGNFRLRASRTGYISPTPITLDINLDDQIELESDIVLINDRAEVSGTTLSQNGNPIQLVSVTATKGDVTYSTRTNSSGNYRFVLSSGEWTINADRNGFVPPQPRQINLGTGDNVQNYNLTMSGGANQVSGFVRRVVYNDDGSTGQLPFPDVEVVATPTSGSSVTTTTSGNGQFTLNLRSGSYSISASAGQHSPDRDVDVVLGFNETLSGIRFEMEPNPSSVSGLVLHSDGSELANTTVSIPGIGSTTSGSNGTYQISIPPGDFQVQANRSGYVASDPVDFSAEAGQNLQGIDFTLAPNASTIKGRVRSSGSPIVRAEIRAVSSSGRVQTTTTDNLGNYELNILPGTWTVTANRSGFLESDEAETVLSAGQVRNNLNFNLVQNTRTVRGNISGPNGGLRNVTVQITSPDNPDFSESTLSQVSGGYAFTLPAGQQYRVRASRSGFQSEQVTTETLTPGEEELTINFTLNANPASIAGTVRNQFEQAIAGATIRAFNSEGEAVGDVTSESSGSYLLGLDSGSYTIEVTRPGHVTASGSTTLEPGQNLTSVNYVLDQNFARINGNVEDPDGNELENAFVNINRTGGSSGSASSSTNADGIFSFNRLTTGTYSITISKTGYNTVNITDFSIEDGDQLNETYVMQPRNGSIQGTVRSMDGSLLSNASITATSSQNQLSSATTNSNGEFTFGTLSPDEYTLVANRTGFAQSDQVTVVLTPDNLNETGVNIDNLQPNNGTISGIIIDQVTDAPLRQVNISATGSTGSGNTITNNQGEFSITNLGIGTYQLSATRDGYTTFTTSLSITAEELDRVQDGSITLNNGTITGTVTNQQQNPLSSNIEVIAYSDNQTYSTQTENDGSFTFSDVQTGETYTIETNAFGQGLNNSTAELNYPMGEPEASLTSPLTVRVDNSIIIGTTGVGNVNVQLIDPSSGEVIRQRASSSDGSYRFRFLRTGNYEVRPLRSGYIFTPETATVDNLAFNESRDISFNADANVGTITVTVQDSDGDPLNQVSVSAVSSNGQIVLNETTNSSGVVTFAQIPANREYTVRASRDGFAAQPDRHTLNLQLNEDAALSFSMAQNLSGIEGTITRASNNQNLRDVRVRIVNSQSGRTNETVTANNGQYQFSSLPAGDYTLTARLSGFVPDTISTISVGFDETVSGQDLQLVSASLNRLQGFVYYQGEGAPGVDVSITSDAEYELITDDLGRYRITNFPVRSGANDTTSVSIAISTDYYNSSQTIRIASDKIVTNVSVPDFILPSGQVVGTVTDGVNPIPGIRTQFNRSGSSSTTEFITDEEGSFVSSPLLRSGEYRVSVATTDYMIPNRSLVINLEDDTDVVETLIALPYKFEPVDSLSAVEPKEVSIDIQPGYDSSGMEATLYYRQSSTSGFSEVSMTREQNRLTGEIPALLSLESVIYYVEVQDDSTPVSFRSQEYELEPLAINLLSNIVLQPNIVGQRLRAGDSYEINVVVRDGENNTMAQEFSDGVGSLEITIPDAGFSANFPDAQSNTMVLQTGNSAETSTLRIRAEFENQVFVQSYQIRVVEDEIESLTLDRPTSRMPNTESANFDIEARNADGNRILLGNSVDLSLTPSGAGTITPSGRFTPSGGVISQVFATINDPVSGLQASSDPVSLYAQIREGEDYELSDGSSMSLFIPASAINETAEVSLRLTAPETPKRFVLAKGSDLSLTASNDVYRLQYSGSSLGSGTRLMLPEPESLELFEGARHIGRFDQQSLQWELFPTTSATSSAQKSFGSVNGGTYQIENFTRLGQFAVLSENEPLNIQRLGILPNPFSPMIEPGGRIGYILTTDAPPAIVDINIYNLRGQLVRNLLEDEPQMPGRYGSSTSPLEIYWDGLTDNGTMANNGRYILQIIARDGRNTITELEQIILIK